MKRLTPALLALLLGAGAANAQSCRAVDPRPWLGVGVFHCRGGTCIIGGATAWMGGEEPTRPPEPENATGPVYDFSVEPLLWRIDPDGPAAGRIRDGDALVAVNGSPVTTRAAGRELTTMRPGEPVRLDLRRDGRLLSVEIVPEMDCRVLTLSAGPDERPGALAVDGPRVGTGRASADTGRPTADRPAGSVNVRRLGLRLAGQTTADVESDGTVRWSFVETPVIIGVEPDGPAERAGLRLGDVVLSVANRSLTTDAGFRALTTAEPGDSLRLTVRSGGEVRTVVVEGEL